jgi:beta-mannosidase
MKIRLCALIFSIFCLLNICEGQVFAKQAEKTLWQPYYISPRSGDQHFSLSGNWDLAYRDVPIAKSEDLSRESKWISAQVPSSVQWQWYLAGQLPHPYYHLNSEKYTWIPDKVWYYRRQFQVPAFARGQYVLLCFDGLGYYSRIWLNGVLLGRHEGMFGGPEAEVSEHLHFQSPNELIVEVQAVSYGATKWDEKSLENVIVPWGLGGGNEYISAGSGVGMKEFLPFGIWRDVRLEIIPRTNLERPFLITRQANSREAHLALTAEVLVNVNSLSFQLHPSGPDFLTDYRNAWTSKLIGTPRQLQMELYDKANSKRVLRQSYQLQLYEGRNWIEKEIRVANPKLWWPNGMGNPNVYLVKLALMEKGKAVDEIEFDYGIRTIGHERSAGPRSQDRWANWQFVVNARRLFVKGINWAWPLDILLNLPRDRYRWLLECARAAGIQMIRVWGGGNPETEDFFQLCDELGIMVWEDFPIANTETAGWKQDVWEAQAMHIIYSLRNHPSLSVWSGGNELNPYSLGNSTAIGILERSLRDFDSSRMFVRTTPDFGDLHVYLDVDPTWYGHLYRLAPFISEAGIFNMPEAQSILHVIDKKEFDSPLGDIFAKDFAASHPEFVHHFMTYANGEPKIMWTRATQVDDMSAQTLEGFSDANQIAAAEFSQTISDLLSANYPVTTGFMPWSFTVPWPIQFFMFVDGLDQPTASYYFLKRTYEPTHIMVSLPNLVWAKRETIPISVKAIHAPATTLIGLSASVDVYDDQFHSIWRREGKLSAKLGPSVATLMMGDFTIPDSLEDKFFFIVAELKQNDGKLLSRSVYWPRCLKLMEDAGFRQKYRASPQPSLRFEHGPWLRPQVGKTRTMLEITVMSRKEINESQTRVRVRVRNTGSNPAFLTHFDIKGTQRTFYGTDNYFWLKPGEELFHELLIRWDDPATRDQALVTVGAWNAETQQAALRPGKR